MKLSYFSIGMLLLLAGMLGSACSSSKNTSTKEYEQEIDAGYGTQKSSQIVNPMGYVETNKDYPSNLELADHLRKIPGLMVSGSGRNVSIQVRGVGSINAGTDPLFVLDGTPIGTEYAMVADAINPNEIKSIRVLKGADAAIYGARAANGVILIRMNKTSK
ncbi:MAG: hypothetical protein D6730_05290 [Bacteroidetes bacterium]|nr:MAG: hypothetical protein D6730_05290 [Bacteroidota bacterium]